MRPRRRTLRKRSAASSTGKLLESAVFYLDESINSRDLYRTLESGGASVRRPGVDIPFGTSDADWLKAAGENNSIVLMRDQRVRPLIGTYHVLQAQFFRPYDGPEDEPEIMISYHRDLSQFSAGHHRRR